MRYWMVKWQDNERFGGKQVDGKTACKYAFGMVAKEMEVCDLGTRKDLAMKRVRDKNLIYVPVSL